MAKEVGRIKIGGLESIPPAKPLASQQEAVSKTKPAPDPNAPQNQNDRSRNNAKGFSIGH
ncbi:MAG: hypothetical protein NTW98_02650 [Candidatus Nomurabacteria bacterium]|nr:hypothetical protein [Candidatus Nomurabacteria bacterium]